MRHKLVGRKTVVLIWDNCPAHVSVTVPSRWADYLKILCLPPNLTSKHQPLDQGIIQSVKSKYKSQLLQELDSALDQWDELRAKGKAMVAGAAGIRYGFRPHLEDVCRLLNDAWTALTADTIINCCIKAECLPTDLHQELHALTAKGQARAAVLDDDQQLADSMAGLLEKLQVFNIHSAVQGNCTLPEVLEDFHQLQLQAPVDKGKLLSAFKANVSIEDREDVAELIAHESLPLLTEDEIGAEPEMEIDEPVRPPVPARPTRQAWNDCLKVTKALIGQELAAGTDSEFLHEFSKQVETFEKRLLMKRNESLKASTLDNFGFSRS